MSYQDRLFESEAIPVGFKYVRGGGVPGGHNVLWDGVREPFIPPMRECNSIALRYSDVVVDIGAYVGTYSIRCARFPVKRVTAYEPTPETFSVLERTALPNLDSVQAAVVGDDRSEVQLHISAGIGVTNSTVLHRRKAASVSVPAISYEKVVRGASIVKVDVEGAEYGYPIVQPSLRAIIIDFHPVPDFDWVGAAKSLIGEIEAAGFRPVIAPAFDRSGWERAGSWERDLVTEGSCEVLMSGRNCCGCGRLTRGTVRSLCSSCYDLWTPKHRKGYARAEAS